ncbi:MAG: hypothetical protein ACYC8V_11085 [Caulobacteraceae bacterium]
MLKDDSLVFFLHLPKTGGTGLARALGELYPPDRVFTANGNVSREFLLANSDDLQRAAFLHGHPLPGIGRRLPVRTRTITLLRNPAHQAVSTYLHVRSDPDNPDHEAATNLGVADFLRANWTYAVFQTGSLAGALMDEPIISERQIEERFNAILAWLDSMFFVGVLECAKESYAQLSKCLRLPSALQPSAVNTADERGFSTVEIDTLREEYEGLRHDRALAPLIALEEATYQKARSILRRRQTPAARNHWKAPQRSVSAASGRSA